MAGGRGAPQGHSEARLNGTFSVAEEDPNFWVPNLARAQMAIERPERKRGRHLTDTDLDDPSAPMLEARLIN
jgi:hypothetical protein